MFGGGGGPQTSAQGFIMPRWSIDLGLRKDWTLKDGKSMSLNFSMNDIFRTQIFNTYSEQTGLFTQEASRLRDPQIVRVNFSYRFGKFDVSLFKRKNTKADQSGGMDMMGSGN